MDAKGRIEEQADEVEVLDGEFVELDSHDLTATQAGALHEAGPGHAALSPQPRLQAAAAAATGFVAGAATVALLRHYGAARLERLAQQEQPKKLPERRRPSWPPEGGTTYLVHIRPLSRPE